ncbi:DUF6651 domain-containing protein [Massilia antarctica]|uniref:DUF6651 domain-containing protein n=1 Tax=Massilia antarctica TaxID=2765360 RepID=UPI00227086D4|nr:DUF6651 domain-containing protein [Massilia sp. H27-R4]MCY0910845.1 hypothetical protein [Massilia sp. H27-R4]
MPFKFNSDGTIATTGEGAAKLPIFVHPDGREAPFDADTTVATIGRLNGEAKANRVRAEESELKLKAFDGIEDGEAARQALTTMKNIKDGDLVAAGKVQEIKDAAAASAKQAVADATRAAEAREQALTATNTKLTADLNNHIVGGSFAGSAFIKDKLAIPADMAQTFFGSRFKVDGGKLVPMDAQGNPIFSATRHGEHADFDEAIQVMVGQYANKDMILKGSGASGGGAQGGGAGAGSKTVPRAQFDSMDQGARASFFKDGGKIAE